MKRFADIVLSLIILSFSAILLAVLALLVKTQLGSPVIFKQQRPGLNAKPFYLYKFRTMTDEKDSTGELLPDAIRLTSFGKFLRKYSLDELPQLVNVLKGDISLVGPRPLLMSYLKLYTDDQARRHEVRPGITGWAQINGRNAISWEEKFAYDVWYVENQSLLLDMKILMLTCLKVLRSEGIENANHVTMPVFKGSQREL